MTSLIKYLGNTIGSQNSESHISVVSNVHVCCAGKK